MSTAKPASDTEPRNKNGTHRFFKRGLHITIPRKHDLEEAVISEERRSLINKVTRQAITALDKYPEEINLADLKQLFTDKHGQPLDDWIYALFDYTKTRFDATGKTRLCGNPIFLHALGTALRTYEIVNTTQPNTGLTMPVDIALAVALAHDLREDGDVSGEELEVRLRSIGAPYLKEQLKFNDLFTRKKAAQRRDPYGLTRPVNKKLYETHVKGIAKYDLALYHAGNPLSGIGLTVKAGGDARDNHETAPQRIFDVNAYEKILIKGNIIEEIAEQFIDETRNLLVMSALMLLTQSRQELLRYIGNLQHKSTEDEIREYVVRNQLRAPDLPARYEGTLQLISEDRARLLEIGRREVSNSIT